MVLVTIEITEGIDIEGVTDADWLLGVEVVSTGAAVEFHTPVALYTGIAADAEGKGALLLSKTLTGVTPGTPNDCSCYFFR